MQADVEVVHRGEGHGQHQGDGQRHHQTGAHTQRQEAHQQHDHHRFGECAHEFGNRIADRAWLIGKQRQTHA